MAEACKAEAATSAVVIMSAAVADHRPAAPAEGKIKKKDGDLELRLEATEDILAWIGKNKTEGQLVVGFALETSDGLAHAQGKLERKNLDLIVLNSLEDAGAGFGHDTNKVTLLDRGTKPQQLPLMSKKETARAILDRIEECL
jgi:phosphopantothenoylcysteine decarboxylase/phosphopantothenate--cysteine ligase